MKSSVFILSLLLILERQAAVVGQYGATKGHFQSSSSGFMLGQKGHLNFGIKGGSEEAAEESIFMQSQHQVFGQDGGDMTETQVSEEHTGVKGAALCRKGQVSQLKSQESQIKSFGQVKSSGQLKSGGSSFGQVKSSTSQVKSFGQLKSNGQLKSYGQLKSSESQVKSFGQVNAYGQTKSQESQVKSFGQVKSQTAQLKSYGQVKSQSGQIKSYGQRKSYGEEDQLSSFGQLKSQNAQLKSYGQQKSQKQSSFSQVKSQNAQLKSYGQQKSLKGFSQQTQHKGFAMDEDMTQVGKRFSDDDLSVQQKSTQQMKTEEDLSQFGQQRQFGQERSQSYKGYLEQYRKKLQEQQNFNQDNYFTKGGAGLYEAQLKG
ncbi:seminal vesicle secretory protein 2-like [Arvicanthis niloticus]|uniref:seminal vesicle secretory protein 2-like n=1 Tax=Arvicanthis niloticus TaxID=61156 RepID=UPI0014871E8F|nr:seminal vesicle secretory protein 2-like [Arvicanthis niloticus]